jgi:hypothetical protein
MISKIVKGTGFRGAAEYLLNGKTRGSQSRGAIIGSNMAGRTPRELSREFAAFRKLRPTLGKAVFHASLSLSPAERHLGDAEFADIGQRYLTSLGFGDAPFVIVRHDDTQHQHIHLLASRITVSGAVVSDKQDFKRAEAVVRKLETAFGLIPVAPTTHQKEECTMDINSKDSIEACVSTASQKAAASLPEPAWTCQPFSPTTEDRRGYKRRILEDAYQTEVRGLLADDIAFIKRHRSGLWIHTKDGGILVDRGDMLTAQKMAPAAAAERVVALAIAKGWQGIELTGSRDFVREAMRSALKSGLAVSPKDKDQMDMLEAILAEMGKGERDTDPVISAKPNLGERLRQRRAPADTPLPQPGRSLLGGTP